MILQALSDAADWLGEALLGPLFMPYDVHPLESPEGFEGAGGAPAYDRARANDIGGAGGSEGNNGGAEGVPVPPGSDPAARTTTDTYCLADTNQSLLW